MANPQSPGWYDDPENPHQLRYFDGVVWTRHTSPPAPAPPQGMPPGRRSTAARRSGAVPSRAALPPVGPVRKHPPGSGPCSRPGRGHARAGRAAAGAMRLRAGWRPRPAGLAAAAAVVPPAAPGPSGGLARATGAHGLRCPARTPDGEALAGWWKRFAARLIDWIIVWLGSLPLTGYFIYRAGNELGPAFDRYVRQIEQGNTGATPPTVTPDVLKWVVAYSVILTLVAIAYEVFFTTRSAAATPGKRASG